MMDINRRKFLLYAGCGLIATTNPCLFVNKAMAAPTEKDTLTDPIAMALGYVEVSPNKKQTCENCLHITGEDGAPIRPCALFENKLVTKGGWCQGWVAK